MTGDALAIARSAAARRRMSLLAAVAAFWVLLEFAWIMTGTSSATVDFGAELDRKLLAAQGEGPNGWPALANAAGQFSAKRRSLREEVESADGLVMTRPDPTLLYGGPAAPDDDFHWELELLAHMREPGGVDHLVDEASRAEVMVRILEGRSDEHGMIGVVLPNLAVFRGMAKAYAARMHLAVEAGDDADLVACFERMLTMARACRSQGILIDHLVGIAIDTLALRELAFIVDERVLDEVTARALGDALARQGWEGPRDQMLEGERAMGHDLVQRMFTDDRHGDGRLQPRFADEYMDLRGGGGGAAVLAFPFHVGRRETKELIDEFWDAYSERAMMTAAERAAAGPTVPVELGWRSFLVQTLMPAVDRTIDMADLIRTRRAGIRVLLAIGAYEAREGRPPGSLDDLVPDFLDGPPVDPCNDGPFGYLLLDGAEVEAFGGRRYLLLSLAADGALDLDPAAVAADDLDADLAVHDTVGAGSDIIINTRRGE